MNRFHHLRVASVTNETRDAVVITFHVSAEQREAFRFIQGQHLTLRAEFAGEELRRSYSICSAPFEPELRIAVKRVQDGRFSTWANQELRPGHIIECLAPSGKFNVPLDPAGERHHVAFAAGSGITPILSILKTTLKAEPKSCFTLIYGNRSSASVLFKEELANLKDEYLDRLNLIYILSREQQDMDLFNGRIDGAKCDQLLEQWIDPATFDVAYICGPQSMRQEVSASLRMHGLRKDCIKMELFDTAARNPRQAAAQARTDAQRTTVTVIQDGRERSFSLSRNTSTLLDAALEQGLELPYSCKGGVCSTCRCKMTQGEVEMDIHYALEDYEIDHGFILTCQSYPLSPSITLDFDQGS